MKKTTNQINTFTGGMNLDSDVNLIPSDLYKYAENIRVVTNDAGTTGILLNVESVCKYSASIPKEETIIGSATINDIGIVITKLKNGYNRIYRLMGFDSNLPQIKLVCSGNIKLCSDDSKRLTVTIVGNYESKTNIKIYFTDGNSHVKTLNIMSNKYTIGSKLVDENGNMLNPGALDITPDASIVPFKLVKVSDGSLNAGMVSYCYQLFNVRGTETVTSLLSPLVHLTTSTSNQGSLHYTGSTIDTPANKSVTLQAPIYAKDFDKCRIIRLFYSKNNSLPNINIIDEIDIAENLTYIKYTDYGSTFLSEITVDEFNALISYLFLALSIEKLLNRLFMANITEQSWVPKGKDGEQYDARAYRANEYGTAKLESASSGSMVIILDLDTDLYSVPVDHDCINPFNTINYVECGKNSRYMYGRNGLLGGYGLNIEYSFITTDIQISGQLKQTRLDLDCSMNVPSKIMTDIKIYENSTGETRSINIDNDERNDARIPNYADPYIDAVLKGYHRDETYRFGIVFYNKKSIASPVLWIGDIRMPRSSQIPTFVYENNTLIGKALGVLFKVKYMPEDAVSYEIVRCDRTEADRTIVMLATGSFPYEYRILEQDDAFGNGSELSSSIEMRPIPWFYNCLDGLRIVTDSNNVAVAPRDQACRDYFRLVSPEICVLGLKIETVLKSNTYLDLLGRYYSPVEGGKVYVLNDDTYTMRLTTQFSQFATVNQLLQPDGSIVNLDTVNYVFTEKNRPDEGTIILPNRNYVNNKIVNYNAIIAKYFYPSFHVERQEIADSNYLKAEISDAKFPPNIPYNVTKGITANRINVGDRTYTNYSMSDFRSNNHLSVNGPAGPCIIAHIPNLSKVFSGIPSRAGGTTLHWSDMFNAVPIFNVRRSSPIQYGGNTTSSRLNSVYITTSSFSLSNGKETNNYVFGGDTYLNLLDYPNTMMFQHPDMDHQIARKMFIGAYIPFESSINMNLFLGDLAHRSYTSSNFVDQFRLLEPTLMGQWHTQDKPYFLYNSVYSTLNTGKLYVPDSIYSEANTLYSNRILSSLAKTNNEIVDSWSKYKVADYLDVDNLWGGITNLKAFKDKLFYFQNTGLGIASVNERSLITDNNINLLVLGTGGILTRCDYLTNSNGSSIIDDKSIISSDNALYWYDYDKNEICVYGDVIGLLSKQKHVQSYLNKINGEDRTKSVSLFDKKYNEVWFNIAGMPLVYNEQLGRFTSFYTFNPKWALLFSDRINAIKDNDLYILNDNTITGLKPVDKLIKLKLAVNKEPTSTKVYDNIWMLGEFKDGEGNNLIQGVIKKLSVNTKHLNSIKEEDDIVLDYREDTYRIPVPREDAHEDTLSLPARMRGKYMECEYELDSENDHTFRIPQITTTYRHSSI